MKIIHINHSDLNGGAARAAYRLNRAFNETSFDVQSLMIVQKKITSDPSVLGPNGVLNKTIALDIYYLGDYASFHGLKIGFRRI